MARVAYALSALLVAIAAQGCGESAFLNEVGRGNVDAVRAMLDRDPGLTQQRDALGKSALHRAVTSGSDQMVVIVLNRAANVNAQDNTGLTPLHVAAWWAPPDRLQMLIDAGADVEATDRFGDTPLHTAAMHGRLANLRQLIRAGADLSRPNDAGLTPAALARKYNQNRAALYLEQSTAMPE